MGDAIFRALLDGEQRPSCTLAGFIEPADDGFVVSGSLMNVSTQPLRGRWLLLPPRGFLAEDAELSLDLAPERSLDFRVVLTDDRPRDRPAGAPFPLTGVMVSNRRAELVESLAPVQPVAVQWPAGTVEIIGNEVILSPTVKNNTGRPLELNWRAEWREQSLHETLALSPGFPQALPLHFSLPEDASLRRIVDHVRVTLTIAGKSERLVRSIRMIRHLVLDDAVPLAPAADGQDYSAALTVSADAAWLRFRCTQNNTQPADEVQFFIDARPPVEQRSLGFIEATRVRLSQENQAVVVPFRQAQFGDGYNRPMDMRHVQAHWRRNANDSELTLAIPRSYFYRLDGNDDKTAASLGLGVALIVRQPDGGPRVVASLAQSGLNSHDPRGGAVVEFVRQPSLRWSACTW
jgi:hypothetical protein